MGNQDPEALRLAYYIRCRNKSYSIDDSSLRSQIYIKQKLNARKSSTRTSYLEQQYQDSLKYTYSKPTYSEYDAPRSMLLRVGRG
jgi:hypothetical protein